MKIIKLIDPLKLTTLDVHPKKIDNSQVRLAFEKCCTCRVAKTPQGPPSCCTRPVLVSESELNLFTHIAKYNLLKNHFGTSSCISQIYVPL
jgi:hypothetical protein